MNGDLERKPGASPDGETASSTAGQAAGTDLESRRRFIRNVSTAAAITLFGKTAPAVFAATSPGGSPPRPSHPVKRIIRSRVIKLEDRMLIPERVVQGSLLRTSLKDCVTALTDEPTYEDAFQKLFKPDDVILIKFNRSASNKLATTEAMAIALVNLLFNSGFNPNQIRLLEAGSGVAKTLRTPAADERWQGKVVEFGRSGKDSFIAALEECTAIINVPFLKTHHLATMTSCLKNLSHGLIRHPARFHGNGCDPSIGEIAARPEIKSKLKLNIVNALRVPFDKGPEAEESDTDSTGIIIMGQDPVACDAVGFATLNQIRNGFGLPPLLTNEQLPRQLLTASDLGVGHYDEGQIALQHLPK